MTFEQIVQTIKNNVLSGIAGKSPNVSLNDLQIEEEVTTERIKVIKEMYLKGTLPIEDLYVPFHAAILDTKNMTNSTVTLTPAATDYKHFKIPAMIGFLGSEAIDFFGDIDMSEEYKVFTNGAWKYRTHRIVPTRKSCVVVDTKYVDDNGLNDCYIINPKDGITNVTAVFIPKDLRCIDDPVAFNIAIDKYHDYSDIPNEIVKRLSEKYIRYYRQGAIAEQPAQS